MSQKNSTNNSHSIKMYLNVKLLVLKNRSLVLLSINSRNTSNFHQSLSILTSFQKGSHYLGSKVFSCLPQLIKNLSHNMKQFKSPLERFSFPYSFYSLDECFNYNKD